MGVLWPVCTDHGLRVTVQSFPTLKGPKISIKIRQGRFITALQSQTTHLIPVNKSSLRRLHFTACCLPSIIDS